jgi:hypothetical protein
MNPHLSMETALAFAAETLPLSERSAIEAHASQCAGCAAMLVQARAERDAIVAGLRLYAAQARPTRRSDWASVAPRFLRSAGPRPRMVARLAASGVGSVVLLLVVTAGLATAAGLATLPPVRNMVRGTLQRVGTEVARRQATVAATATARPTTRAGRGNLPASATPTPTQAAAPVDSRQHDRDADLRQIEGQDILSDASSADSGTPTPPYGAAPMTPVYGTRVVPTPTGMAGPGNPGPGRGRRGTPEPGGTPRTPGHGERPSPEPTERGGRPLPGTPHPTGGPPPGQRTPEPPGQGTPRDREPGPPPRGTPDHNTPRPPGGGPPGQHTPHPPGERTPRDRDPGPPQGGTPGAATPQPPGGGA